MKTLLLNTIIICLISCQKHETPDLIILGDTIYTSNAPTNKFSAIAIKNDRITAIGAQSEILNSKGSETQIIDVGNAFIMPGFIEGHGHFSGLGSSLQNLNFLKDTSWVDIKNKVVEKAKYLEKGEWIFGRGWHQEKWTIQPDDHVSDYPRHDELSSLTPDNPVLLVHASGHALIANQLAMDLSGITIESPNPQGGEIVRDETGKLVGVFEERAATKIKKTYGEYLDGLDQDERYNNWLEGINLAELECLKNGITSFQDAGSGFDEISLYETLAKNGELDIRLWVMLRESSEDMKGKVSDVRKIGYGNNYYTCRAIKSEIDGALGSYGAWLLEPYNDKGGFYGQNTTSIDEVETIASMAYANDMQLCVHAIGDRANRELLDIIENYQGKEEKDLRWRVEHAQHLNPNDIDRFKNTGAIASMQAVHCTSDAPFVVKRLGEWRARIGAYAWKSLLDRDVVIVNGTDTPVEDVNPIANFYASVSRTRLDNGMRFFVEQRMSREQALKSYTIDAAFGAFEEEIKGSIEVGKLADITILDTNLLLCSDDDIPKTNVLYTIVGGKIKYESRQK